MTAAERQRVHRARKYARIDAMPKILCECGCGAPIAPITRGLQPARFARGHNPDGAATRFKPGENTGGSNPRWRGDDPPPSYPWNGYVMVYVGLGHPLAKNGSSYNLEHRVVMGRAIGRPLRSDEQVHHVNGDRTDNRLENLQVLRGAHGTGVAYRCCDCGSHNVEPTPLNTPASGPMTLSVEGGDANHA